MKFSKNRTGQSKLDTNDLMDNSELQEDKEEAMENIFQKYETEIKTHIHINKEMNLTIENQTKKAEELQEKNNGNSETIEKLQAENTRQTSLVDEVSKENEVFRQALYKIEVNQDDDQIIAHFVSFNYIQFIKLKYREIVEKC